MRVLHLPIIMCNQVWEMSRALRRIGVESDYMIWDDNDCGWLLPGKPDYNLNIYHRKLNKEINNISRDLKIFFWLALTKYDVFHYHSNYSLFEDGFDLKVLKFFRKKIVVSYWGCDIRTKEGNKKYKYNTCEVCKVDCSDEKKKIAMNMFAKYADICIAQSKEISEYAPPRSIIFPAFIDTNYWKSSKTPRIKNEIFTIFHAFGNSKNRGDVKGTESLIKAINVLKKEGYKIQLLFLDKVDNKNLKKEYEKSDIVVEQLRAGEHGITALEGMSMGKPVISYLRDDILKYNPDSPIISANPDSITKVLKWALNNPEELKKIGIQSREYVVKYHDSSIMVKKLYRLYQSLY